MCVGFILAHPCTPELYHPKIFYHSRCEDLNTCLSEESFATEFATYKCSSCLDEKELAQKNSDIECHIDNMKSIVGWLVSLIPKERRTIVTNDKRNGKISNIILELQQAGKDIWAMRMDNYSLGKILRDKDAQLQHWEEDMVRLQPLLAHTEATIKGLLECAAGEGVSRAGPGNEGSSAAIHNGRQAEALELIQQLQSLRMEDKENWDASGQSQVSMEKGSGGVSKQVPLANDVQKPSSGGRNCPVPSLADQVRAGENFVAGAKKVNDQDTYTEVDDWDLVTDAPETIEVEVHMLSEKRQMFANALAQDVNKRLTQLREDAQKRVGRDLVQSILSNERSQPAEVQARITQKCYTASLEVEKMVAVATTDIKRTTAGTISAFNQPSTILLPAHRTLTFSLAGAPARRQDNTRSMGGILGNCDTVHPDPAGTNAREGIVGSPNATPRKRLGNNRHPGQSDNARGR